MRPKTIAPPHGNVTFVFTDLVGSSQIAKRLPYRDYEGNLLDPQFALFSRLITKHNGLECGTPAGDSVMAAFQSVHDALDCAVEMQRELPQITYTDPNGTPWTLTARIGVHRSVEEVIPTGKGLYLGHPEVNYAARIMAIAHAGQIVVSDSARIAAGTRHEVFQPFPNRRIKDGADKPETVHELRYDGKERGEPGAQFVPGWFREKNRYVPRPALENHIADLFALRTRPDSPYRLMTLHGMGGMGKTRLGMQCCLNAAGLFEGRLFLARLDGISDEALTADDTRRDYLVAEIAKAFGLSELSPTEQNLPDLLPKDVPMLLFLDNYETVKGEASARLLMRLLEYCPDLCLLVTSRTEVGLQGVEMVQDVEGLLPNEARDLLVTRVRERRANLAWAPSAAEETALSQIMVETEHIPLALELVAAHVGELSLAEIATDLAKEPLGEMTQTSEGSYTSDPSWRHETLEKCYNWSWRLLDADAQKALICLSLFADDCPFEEIAGCFPEIKRALLAHLHRASLAKREEVAGRSLYSLLRPTRLYARRRLSELDTNRICQDRFVTTYVQVVKDNGSEDNLEVQEKRERLEGSWRHAMSAVDVASMLDDVGSCGAIADGMIHFIKRQVLWNEALPLYVQSLERRRKILGSDHPSTAFSLNSLADLYFYLSNYSAAQPLYEEALAIREKVLGHNHPDTAQSLNNLAYLYQKQGDNSAAQPLYERALEICKNVLGAKHPHTARSLNNLANLCEFQGKYSEAETLYKQAVTICEQTLGAEHPDTLSSLGNLANLYELQGNYPAAQSLLEHTLAIRKKVLGAEHPDTARSLNNLAGLYMSQGNYPVAQPLYEQALAIQERMLGVEHLETGHSLNNLAFLYFRQSNYNAAQPLLERALAIYEKVLGIQHPTTATCLNNLASIFQKRENYAAAEPLFKQALTIQEKLSGAEHPDTARSLSNLAILYRHQKNYSAAQPLIERALAIYEKVLGEAHPETAITLNNLAKLFEDQEDYSAAQPLYDRALAIYEKVLGEAHPETRKMRENYTIFMLKMEELEA